MGSQLCSSRGISHYLFNTSKHVIMLAPPISLINLIAFFIVKLCSLHLKDKSIHKHMLPHFWQHIRQDKIVQPH